MKTPWSELIQYGTAAAAIIVITIGGIILLTVVGIAIVLAKISLFIR